MTDSTPVGRITTMLQRAGYQAIPVPLLIGGLKFEFAAALVGTGYASDLIIVADTAYEEEGRLARKVEGAARALDISRSTRPLTLVVTGPRPSSATVDSLARVCRVLPTGTLSSADDSSLKNWLAVLLPLDIPQNDVLVADPLNQVKLHASNLDEVMMKLVEAAPLGKQTVREELHRLIDESATLRGGVI